MRNNPILIVHGEPNSIFSEILFKTYKKKIVEKFNRPILIIGSLDLLKSQMKFLKYSIKTKNISLKNLKNLKLNKKIINVIDVKYSYKKAFDKVSDNSSTYISKCFEIAMELLKKKECFCFNKWTYIKKIFFKKKIFRNY